MQKSHDTAGCHQAMARNKKTNPDNSYSNFAQKDVLKELNQDKPLHNTQDFYIGKVRALCKENTPTNKNV
eukprot:6474873-Amphidinium_carterae.1